MESFLLQVQSLCASLPRS